jgi:peptidyl-prolyl cis-trans isomerase D
VASVGPVDKATLAAQTSQAVADAAFAAPKGVLPAPVKGLLGYGVVRVDDIVVKPARTLDQAKGEIAAALLADKRKAALASVTSKIDDSFSKGGALSDAAKELGVNLVPPRRSTPMAASLATPRRRLRPSWPRPFRPPSPWSANMRPSSPSWSRARSS